MHHQPLHWANIIYIHVLFRYKPSPNFLSAAPGDPNYQTLTDLDNERIFGRDKAIKRHNNEMAEQRKSSTSSSGQKWIDVSYETDDVNKNCKIECLYVQ